MKLEVIHKSPTKSVHPYPILFVHGANAGAWCWDMHFVDFFASCGFETYAMSLRGHGNSEGQEFVSLYSLLSYVEDLENVIGSLPKTPILVGHSMGGFIVQKYLMEHELPAAVLMASVPPSGMLDSAFKMLLDYPAICNKIGFINFFPKAMWEYLISAEEVRDLFFSNETPIEQVEPYISYFQHESLRAMSDMFLIRIEPEKIKTPMMITGGSKDIIIPTAYIRITAQEYNTYEYLFSDMGHAMMLEPSWKNLANCINLWLEVRGL